MTPHMLEQALTLASMAQEDEALQRILLKFHDSFADGAMGCLTYFKMLENSEGEISKIELMERVEKMRADLDIYFLAKAAEFLGASMTHLEKFGGMERLVKNDKWIENYFRTMGTLCIYQAYREKMYDFCLLIEQAETTNGMEN